MNNAIFHFRFRQLWNTFREIPPVYLILVIGITVLLGIALFRIIAYPTGGLLVALLLVIFIYMIHQRRGDYLFIHHIELHPARVFSLEYLLISAPFVVMEIIQGHLLPGLGLALFAFAIGFIKRNVQRTKRYFPVPRFIPYSAFEWRVGFRRYGLLFIVCYLGAWGGLFVPYVSLGIFWVFTLGLADAFRYSESRAILCANELPPNRFLTAKLRQTLLVYLIALLPVCLAYALIYPADWWLPLYFLFYMMVNVGLLLVSKYAFYRPQEKIVAGQIAITVSFFGVFLPLIFPLTLIYFIKNYLAARRNLTLYLDAYN